MLKLETRWGAIPSDVVDGDRLGKQCGEGNGDAEELTAPFERTSVKSNRFWDLASHFRVT